MEHAIFQLSSKKTGTIDPKVDIPEIKVTFQNGVKRRLMLTHHDAIPNSNSIDRSRLCNYMGHVEYDEMDSVVAVTGCLMGDNQDEKTHITILSQHSPKHKTFSIDNSGKTTHIKMHPHYEYISFLDNDFISDDSVTSESKDSSIRVRRDWRDADRVYADDAIINKEWEHDADKVDDEERKDVPFYIAIKIRLGYDNSTKDYIEEKGEMVDTWLSEVMVHAEAHYRHRSLNP